MNLSFLWQRLSHIKTLELQAVSLQPEWKGTALGDVTLTEINQDILIFSETGEWNAETRPRIKFFNIYRWRRDENGNLELSHLRNGIDMAPVHLLNFKQTDDYNLHSLQPHYCHQDVYTASLSITENIIELEWSIIGPAKKQIVKCLYR
jgi:hypothetical protein